MVIFLSERMNNTRTMNCHLELRCCDLGATRIPPVNSNGPTTETDFGQHPEYLERVLEKFPASLLVASLCRGCRYWTECASGVACVIDFHGSDLCAHHHLFPSTKVHSRALRQVVVWREDCQSSRLCGPIAFGWSTPTSQQAVKVDCTVVHDIVGGIRKHMQLAIRDVVE